MFYDKDLMNSQSLGTIWRAGNSVNYDSDEELSMAKICDRLGSWVDNDHHEAHRRLALRTSSVLVEGAARVYKRKMEQLFDDTKRLEREMSLKRSRFIYDENESTTLSSSGSNIRSLCTLEHSANDTTASSHFSYTDGQITHSETQYKSSVISNNQTTQEDITKTIEKVDKEIQTSMGDHEDANNGNFNQNLPFGFILIHDNYNSRIPSKIIISSLNPNVKKLV